jgi:hypothetical protein
MAAVLRITARHPVLVFMVIGLVAGFLTAAIRPIADADVLPYGLPHGLVKLPAVRQPSPHQAAGYRNQ